MAYHVDLDSILLQRPPLSPPNLGSTIEATQKAFFGGRCQVFVNIFTIFLHDRNFGPTLSEIVASYPGISSMMADMWLREGTDEGEVKGFPSGCFVQYANGTYMILKQGILAEVISVCGTAEGAVHVACQRIERNIIEATRTIPGHVLCRFDVAKDTGSCYCPSRIFLSHRSKHGHNP